MDVKVGDTVLFAKYAGTEIKMDGKKLLILRESRHPRNRRRLAGNRQQIYIKESRIMAAKQIVFLKMPAGA